MKQSVYHKLGMAFVAFFLGGVGATLAAGREPIELVLPTKKPALLWSYTTVLFVTNRKVTQPDLVRAQAGTGSIIEEFFTNISSDTVSSGEACVAYPTNRAVAEQNYMDDDIESPAKFFAVKGYIPIGSTRDFRLAATHQLDESFEFNCPNKETGNENIPLLFIHGWRASYSAGVTRAAQLKLDLDRRLVVVLSWPADKSGFLSSYPSAENEEVKASGLVSRVVNLIATSTSERPSVIAHSMGARLYVDGMESIIKGTHNFSISSMSTILAAPDVEVDSFQTQFDFFKLANLYTTVYCGYDFALQFSGVVHGGRRLGYCTDSDVATTAPEEMVRVKGRFYDVWRHSYFLSSPQMISDMRAVLFRGEHRLNSREGLRVPSRDLELK